MTEQATNISPEVAAAINAAIVATAQREASKHGLTADIGDDPFVNTSGTSAKVIAKFHAHVEPGQRGRRSTKPELPEHLYMTLVTGDTSMVGFFTTKSGATGAKSQYGGEVAKVPLDDVPVKYKLAPTSKHFMSVNEMHEDSKQATTRLSREILGKEPKRSENSPVTREAAKAGAKPKMVYIAVNTDTNEVLAEPKRKDAAAKLDVIENGELIKIPAEKLPKKIHLGGEATSVTPQMLGRLRNMVG